MIDSEELLNRMRHHMHGIEKKIVDAVDNEEWWEAARLETYLSGLDMGTIFVQQMPKEQKERR